MRDLPDSFRPNSSPTAVFTIIEPVDRAGVGRLLTEVLRAGFHRLLRIDMFAGYDRVNSYDSRYNVLEWRRIRGSANRLETFHT